MCTVAHACLFAIVVVERGHCVPGVAMCALRVCTHTHHTHTLFHSMIFAPHTVFHVQQGQLAHSHTPCGNAFCIGGLHCSQTRYYTVGVSPSSPSGFAVLYLLGLSFDLRLSPVLALCTFGLLQSISQMQSRSYCGPQPLCDLFAASLRLLFKPTSLSALASEKGAVVLAW